MDNTTTNTTAPPAFTTIILIGPPPPFPAPPRSIDFSPLIFIFGIIALITIPVLLYAFFFTVPCSSSSHRRRSISSDDLPTTPTESAPPPTTATPEDSGVAAPAPSSKFRKGKECAICLSALASGQEVRQLSACKHAFHASCIDKWLSSNPNCPICRASVPDASNLV